MIWKSSNDACLGRVLQELSSSSQSVRFLVELWAGTLENIQPMDIKDRVDKAILAFSMGDDEGAEALLNECLSHNPLCVDAMRALSEVLLSMQKTEEAEDICRRALSEAPEDLSLMVSLARILVRKGDKEGAEEATSKARILGWKEELAEDD
jgi:predicted Zn-dependent protease